MQNLSPFKRLQVWHTLTSNFWFQIDFFLVMKWRTLLFFSQCGDSVLIFWWGHFVRNRKCRSVSQQFDIFYGEYLFIIIHFVATITVIYYLDMCEFITSVIILQPNMINHICIQYLTFVIKITQKWSPILLFFLINVCM